MKQILDKLDTFESFDDEKINEVIADFFRLYEQNDRHKYHEITLYVINKYQRPEESESISIILSNLEQIMNRVEALCDCNAEKPIDRCARANAPEYSCEKMIESETEKHCYEYKWLHRKLDKLHDHISLEYTRISDIRRHNSKTENVLKSITLKENELNDAIISAQKEIEDVRFLSESTEEMFDKIQTSVEETKKEFGEIQNTAQSAQERVDKIQKSVDENETKLKNIETQYITILGIFASIVLAFTGGIAFSTSVLENIDAISPYRLSAVVIGLAFILINVVYVLVWFIRELNKRKDEKVGYPGFMIFVNVILVLAIVATIFFWHQGTESVDTLKDESTLQITIEEHSNKTQ